MQRHQIGSFVATVLGDIESDDPVRYRYIMAIVEDGKQEPAMYVVSEHNTDSSAGNESRYRLRVIMGNEEKTLSPSDEWGEVDKFSLAGMGIIAKLMKLQDEQPVRLM